MNEPMNGGNGGAGDGVVTDEQMFDTSLPLSERSTVSLSPPAPLRDSAKRRKKRSTKTKDSRDGTSPVVSSPSSANGTKRKKSKRTTLQYTVRYPILQSYPIQSKACTILIDFSSSRSTSSATTTMRFASCRCRATSRTRS